MTKLVFAESLEEDTSLIESTLSDEPNFDNQAPCAFGLFLINGGNFEQIEAEFQRSSQKDLRTSLCVINELASRIPEAYQQLISRPDILRVLELLVQSPDVQNVDERRLPTPFLQGCLEAASTTNNFEVASFLLEHFPRKAAGEGIFFSEQATAIYRQIIYRPDALEILKHLAETPHMQWGIESEEASIFAQGCLEIASESNSLKLLSFLLENFPHNNNANSYESRITEVYQQSILQPNSLENLQNFVRDSYADGSLQQEEISPFLQRYLAAASDLNNIEIASFLLEEFPQEIENYEVLSNSAKHSDLQLLNLFFDHHPPEFFLQSFNDSGDTVAHIAAAFGNANGIRRLHDIASETLTSKNSFDDTPLLLATKYGHPSVVETLLEFGLTTEDLGQSGSKQQTVLALTSLYGEEYLTELFLKQNLPPEIFTKANEEDYFPIHLAAKHGHLKIFQDLLPLTELTELESEKLVRCAILGNNSEIAKAAIKILVESDAKIDAPDSDGKTSLHFAAEQQNVAAAALLLASGANISTIDQKGLTPSEYFSDENQEELLNILSTLQRQKPATTSESEKPKTDLSTMQDVSSLANPSRVEQESR